MGTKIFRTIGFKPMITKFIKDFKRHPGETLGALWGVFWIGFGIYLVLEIIVL